MHYGLCENGEFSNQLDMDWAWWPSGLCFGLKSYGFQPCPQELSLYVIAYVAGAKGEISRMRARTRAEKEEGAFFSLCTFLSCAILKLSNKINSSSECCLSGQCYPCVAGHCVMFLSNRLLIRLE